MSLVSDPVCTTPESLSAAKEQRLLHEQRLRRIMLNCLIGSGIIQGFLLTTVSLQKANPIVAAIPEQEIVIESMEDLPAELMDDPELQADDGTGDGEPMLEAGSGGGDETLQVATLETSETAQPESETSEIDPETSATASEVTEDSLETESAIDQSISDDLSKPTVEQPSATTSDASKLAAASSANTSENSTVPGIFQKSGSGLGSGGGSGSNTGNGAGQGAGSGSGTQLGKGSGDRNNLRTGARPTPKAPPKPSQPPKPLQPQTAVAKGGSGAGSVVLPKPRPRRNYDRLSYDRGTGDRTLAGYRPRVIPVYDNQGKLIDLKVDKPSGDPELDAAFERVKAEKINDLRKRLENRPPEERDRPIRLRFQEDQLNAREREQADRNRSITAQQDADRRIERAAEAPTQTGGISLPIPAPAIIPTIAEPPARSQPEPVYIPPEPAPEPEYIPPAPEPEYIPPAPEPEYIPPAPEPEYIPPAPEPAPVEVPPIEATIEAPITP